MATRRKSSIKEKFLFLRWDLMDLHSHLRLRALPDATALGKGMVIELGCGPGLNLLRMAHANPAIDATGYDSSLEALEWGRRMIAQVNLGGSVKLEEKNLAAELPASVGNADCILFMDVLEHLPDPAAAALAIAEKMKKGARLWVSVPTRLYPKVLGRSFHESIGHLHDGFGLGEVESLFKALEPVRHVYSTGLLTWPGAALFYRWRAKGRMLRVLKILVTLPFRYIDWVNGPRSSCSLFVEFLKR
jgi:SAM-dependent methyltransferase